MDEARFTFLQVYDVSNMLHGVNEQTQAWIMKPQKITPTQIDINFEQ